MVGIKDQFGMCDDEGNKGEYLYIYSDFGLIVGNFVS